MAAENNTKITVEITVSKPIEKIWEFWTLPTHIMQWNFASPEWHCPIVENNLQPGGKFVYRMEVWDLTFQVLIRR